MTGARRAAAAAAALALAACGTPSHALDAKDRDVLAAPESLDWRPATRADVVGDFESERITGDAAASLRRVLYTFASDGTFSGAALVQEGDHAKFQVLSGAWSLDGSTLHLGDAEPAKALAAPGHLRLDAEGGSAWFRRAK